MPRFYVPDVSYEIGSEIPLPPSSVHHAMRVLRMREGDEAEIFDGKGNSARGKIHFSKDYASVFIEKISHEENDTLKIVLAQSLVSNEKMDWIVEKACELGVSKLIVFPAERSEIKLTGEKLEKRLQRWSKIILSSCEQCKRNSLLDIRFLPSLKSLSDDIVCERNYVLCPSSPNTEKESLAVPKSVMFVIGPEGGLSNNEISLLLEKGFLRKQLGDLVLRTETAGIVAAAYAQTLWSWKN